MAYTGKDGAVYELNLIDTPGHVDFAYEVSRALAACEGALLVVDATQGIEAQTLANLYLALEMDLEVIPVINKVDLPSARTEEVSRDVATLLGVDPASMIPISAKTGENIAAVLEAIVSRIHPPSGSIDSPARGLIFDSHYDSYRGVVAYLRVREGVLRMKDALKVMSTDARFEAIEIGYFAPDMRATGELAAGEVGYIATGLKSVQECRVGDTITSATNPAAEPMPGYRTLKPMVFAGFYPVEGENYSDLKDALEKLQLNDASLVYTPETSQALNFGFRCGFLGMFHMDIIQERLEREYDLDVIATAPSVEYEVLMINGTVRRVASPAFLPPQDQIQEVREPWMEVQVFTPESSYGVVMDLVTGRRGIFREQAYTSPGRVQLTFELPLAELIVDFYDRLKSRTRGYASLDYRFIEYRPEDLVRLDIYLNDELVDALASIVHKDQAYHRGQALVTKLKDVIPRQQFVVPVQAVADGRVISRANVKAMRKDVLAKCYGGDITRKRKLLEKQKKGKKRLKKVGSVEISQEAFMAVLGIGGDD
jgi:GTP-binding protein LepA